MPGTPPAGTALWSRVLRDPALHDLPYRVETSADDQILLSPHKPRHSFLQSRLVRLMLEHLPQTGEPTVEFAVETPEGVKVPDVVWISDERAAQIPDDIDASPVLPEVVVEVLSRSDPKRAMALKRALYLACGAVEVWTCDQNGLLTFYDASGELGASALAPSFPPSVPS